MSISDTLRARLSRPMSALGFSFACILLAVIAGAGLTGYQAGVTQRETQLRATQTYELRQQFELGTADLAAGRATVAVERFNFILARDPAYPGAAEGLAQAQAALNVGAATATPAPPPLPTASGQDPQAYFELAQEYVALGNWDGVITQIAILRGLDPRYQAVQTDGLLFVALRNRGVARVQGKELEAGIFDLDQAGAFGPLDSEAVNYRAWARLYLNAQSFWGVNWALTVQSLELLHALAPNFHDTTSRYAEATANYGRQLDAAGDACGAAGQYTVAASLQTDPAVNDALTAAQAACALATPTADPGAASATPDPALITATP